MKLLEHSFGHLFVHITLFSGFALLLPSMTSALEQHTKPWLASPIFFAVGSLLVIVSIAILYQIKQSVPNVLRTLGATMFIPGALTTVSQVIELRSNTLTTGFSILDDVTQFYISHSAPEAVEVAAAYLAIGGMLYWTGTALKSAKEKLF